MQQGRSASEIFLEGRAMREGPKVPSEARDPRGGGV